MRVQPHFAAAAAISAVPLAVSAASPPQARACDLTTHCYAIAQLGDTVHQQVRSASVNVGLYCMDVPQVHGTDFLTDEMWVGISSGSYQGGSWVEAGTIGGFVNPGKPTYPVYFYSYQQANVSGSNAQYNEHLSTAFYPTVPPDSNFQNVQIWQDSSNKAKWWAYTPGTNNGQAAEIGPFPTTYAALDAQTGVETTQDGSLDWGESRSMQYQDEYGTWWSSWAQGGEPLGLYLLGGNQQGAGMADSWLGTPGTDVQYGQHLYCAGG